MFSVLRQPQSLVLKKKKNKSDLGKKKKPRKAKPLILKEKAGAGSERCASLPPQDLPMGLRGGGDALAQDCRHQVPWTLQRNGLP